MPLNTMIKRKGKALPIRWGGFHVAAMVFAASWDSGVGPFVDNTDPRDRDVKPKFDDGGELDYPNDPFPITPGDAWRLMDYAYIGATPMNSGDYVLTRKHRFIDVTDGEVLDLRKGDVLSAWRA